MENKTNTKKKKKPLYRMIYEQQREKILDGTYRDGDLLPYERELCQQYGVDRVTVRQAMRMLVEDGLIEKRTGVGSFVHRGGPAKPAAAQNTAPDIQGQRFLYLLPVSALNVIANPESYNAELFHFLQQECSRAGAMLVYMIENDPQLEALAPGQYSGCFLVSRVNAELAAKIAALMPVVGLNMTNPAFCSALVEDEGGSCLAVRHLIELGHRRIAMVGNSPQLYTTSLRQRGYRRALEEAGLPFDARYVAFVDDAQVDAAVCVEQILDGLSPHEQPTAFFFHADLLAVCGLSMLMRRGLRIPEDVSIIGFNNTNISQRVYPPLTTVDTQRDLLAFEAMTLMLRRIANPALRRILVYVPAQLEVRASIAPPAL